ncbi:phage gp6-like head-tail connector protein [Cronobacter sakazakii]|uniref:phage portal protein n=1 Tax=Cronobacter sakazakii TaxID=28141 RepID=UPI000CFCFCB7|nr:phage portal protein [Cronobacter sakazakii]ELY2671948.1 phage gp6-like head-tail connector protein [Cronobacter sakazakii]ELY4432072.1 phage gp6-like head-tail connector protein [Cronobacter sakazakii]ELY4457371.1 phage gp6-like head-tail connector protein [Cronobacter sakazakii]MDK1064001.1 phage gp6-like head-tail connector protein [Cronobacter sakazakii]PQX92025.1 phage portal protein [Cronobacter sakazakii]
MNERELTLIKVLGEEFGQALTEMREGFTKSLDEQRQVYDEKLNMLSRQLEEIKSIPAPDFGAMVEEAVAALPAPELPQLPDIASMVSEAVANIPPPENGKSLTPVDVQPMLQEMVDKAFGAIPTPKDGKDYDPAVLKQAVEEAVSNAVANLPPPEPGENGRDALALEILPFIDEEKSYPRGSYATHNGGLWRAYEKTHGMRGWECVVDGVAGVEIERSEQRRFTLTVNRASGSRETKSFDVPVMIYKGVFKSGQEYLPGDTVTWGGSLWHCDDQTQDKPGETGAKGWTLATKRGRDGRDKRD